MWAINKPSSVLDLYVIHSHFCVLAPIGVGVGVKIPVHLYERLAKRSPHERVDDGVDAGVEVGERFDDCRA